MDEDFTFWSIIFVGVQLVLFGTPVTKDIVVESHIVHNGRLLCKESQEVLKNRVKKKNDTQNVTDKYQKARPGNMVCEKCQELYKNSKDSKYHAWVSGKTVSETKQPEPLNF